MRGESLRPEVGQICFNSGFKWLFPPAQCMSLLPQALLAFKAIEDGVERKCTAQFQPECFLAVVFHLWTLQHFHGEQFK